MASIETIRRITIEARASGVEQATARLNDTTRAIGTMEGAVTRARRAYDPLFTATERLAAVQRTATLAVAAGNLTQDEANRLYDQAANKLTGYGRELEKVTRLEIQARAAQEASARAAAQANQQTLNSRFGIGAAPGRDAVGDFTAAANAADNLRARYSPLFAAQRQYLATLSEIKDASRSGILTENERATALERTKAAFAAQVTTMRSGQAGGGGLQAYQAQNLLYQGSDIISSLGSGAPLSTVALQQGPQIAQVFAGPGGASVKGAFAAAMEAASGLAARVGIVGGVLGGVATAAAAAAAAGLSYANSQRETEKALLGVGRASGVTAGQIAELAAVNASAGGVSTRSARELAAGYASTGRIGGEIIAGLIRNTKDFAATTGQDVPDAARMLAEAFADPAKGADALNERLGFLNDTTRETIQRLQAQGDRLAAQRALMDAYTGSLTKASDTMSGWGRVTEAVGTTIGDIWDKIGRQVDRVVTGGSLEEQIAAARRTLGNAQVAAEGGFGLFSSKDVERAQAALDKLEAKAAQVRAMSDQKEAARNSITLGNLIRSTQPDQAEIKGLQDKIEQLKKALADPAKFNLDLFGLYSANTAVTNLSRSFQALTEDVDKFGSRAVAAMNRTADLANRTVGFSASARAAAEIKDRFDQLERTADSRELAGLRRARSTELDTLQKTTYQTTGSYRTNIRDVPDAFRDRIYQAAIGQGLDPSFLASVAAQESGNFNPRVVSGQKRSTAGAIGLMQFMPGTAAQYGIDPTNPGQSIDAAALYLRRSLDKRNGNEALALADYNAGPGRVNSVGGDISRLPAETQNYIAKILTATPQATELAKAQKARTDGLESERQGLEIANRLLGRNGEAYDAATRAQQMLADAERQGIPVTDAYRAQIERVAGGMAAANRALADTRLGRDLEFERDQLGRSAGDQSAFARARAAFGDTTSDPARAAIGRIREIDMMKDARGTFQDTFGGVISSLSRGASAAQVANQALTRFADKMINFGTDAVGGLLFGGGKGGGGGIFGNLISSFAGGAGGIDVGATSWMPKFADGGIMTSEGALPLHRYATGGIANTPQVALFGEGRGPEAFVPLPDGRRIPVAMTMSGEPAGTGSGQMVDSRYYSFDLRGSSLTEAQVRAALTQAIAANNQERDRTHFERVETLRRMGPY